MELEGAEALPQRPKRSKSQNPNSILTTASLPEELITEILLRLPVKSLLKARSVSKSWLSLISTPLFAKTHLKLFTYNKDYTHHRFIFVLPNEDMKYCYVGSVLYGQVVEAFSLDYPGKNLRAHPQFVGSFNGLICLAFRVGSGRMHRLFLWNPSIRKYRELPDQECLSFSSTFGFTYDEFQDDYKVVGIFPTYNYKDRYRVQVKIYSLKSHSWRIIDDLRGWKLTDKPGKLVNRKLHWLDCDQTIVSIDLVDEKWAEVERPCYSREYGFFMLEAIRGDLSLFCNPKFGCDHADVWVMKEYGIVESWTKMFTITRPDDYVRIMFRPPIFMSNEGEILLRHGLRLMKYNSKNNASTSLDVMKFAQSHSVEFYTESLIGLF